MQLSKILLFHKRSTYQLQAIDYRDKRFLSLLEKEDKAVERVKKAHNEHLRTIEAITNELKRKNIQFSVKARSALEHRITDIDLLIAAGGDGTFIDASHYLDKVPILGVNSALSSSFGHFCLANENNFASILQKIEAGSITPVNLLRLVLILNGKTLPYYALNEVLIAHKSPAGTSRYILGIRDAEEEQLSSGILIGTPAGSTGTLRSAGGEVLPINTNQFQYVVREPCIRPGQEKSLCKGLLGENDEVKIISQMRTGSIFIDGQHLEYPFALGDELIIKKAPLNLSAFVDTNVNNSFFKIASDKFVKNI